MDKAPKAVILRGEDSGEGSEIHPYSKFMDPSLLCPPRDQILAAPLTRGDSYTLAIPPHPSSSLRLHLIATFNLPHLLAVAIDQPTIHAVTGEWDVPTCF